MFARAYAARSRPPTATPTVDVARGDATNCTSPTVNPSGFAAATHFGFGALNSRPPFPAGEIACATPGFVLRYDQISRIFETLMLRLSKKTDYALIAMKHLASDPRRRAASAREMTFRSS